jgi:Tol biopolymer transport system component
MDLTRIKTFLYGVSVLIMLFYLSGCDSDNPTKYDPPGDPPVYPLIDGYPSWSPDGTKIIYNHNGITRIDIGGSYHIDRDSSGLWMVNIDGSNPHLILRGDDINADWSLDGNWIVFEQGAQIYKVPVVNNSIDTSQITQLTFQGSNFFPSWNPTGDWIAYDSNENSPNGMKFIWKMKSDGTQKIRIAYDPTKGEIRMPSWSKNGNKIVHTRYSTEFTSTEVFEMDPSGNNLLRLTFNNFTDYYPKFSPDDSKIIFESNANVWFMNSNGMNQKQLTFNSGLQPSWSSDGQKIVYIGFADDNKYDPSNDGTVWIMNADGSNKQQVTFGP